MNYVKGYGEDEYGLVCFKVNLMGKQVIRAGFIKRVLPNGNLEIKAQYGGYWTILPSELISKSEGR